MKLYKLFLVGAVVCFTVLGGAQSLTPEVLSTAGGSAQVGTIRISWTLGETAISRWTTHSGGSVTEGFHQPILVLTTEGTPTIALVRIAPNPVQSTLQLMVDNKEAKELTATLIDVQGRILLKLNHLTIGNTEVSLEKYPTGSYFLSIQYANELPLQTFKVVKTQ